MPQLDSLTAAIIFPTGLYLCSKQNLPWHPSSNNAIIQNLTLFQDYVKLTSWVFDHAVKWVDFCQEEVAYMFTVGDKVLYPMHGAAVIRDVEQKVIDGR